MSRNPTLEKAVAAAVAAASSDGRVHSAQDVQDAKTRAEQMIARMGGDTKEIMAGMCDISNSNLAVGLPATRMTLTHMIRAANLRDSAKSKAQNMIAQISPVTDHVGITVRYRLRDTGAQGTVHIGLTECPRLHNMDNQVNKVKPLVTDESWVGITQHMTALVNLGMKIYRETIAKNLDIVRHINSLAEDDPCEKYLCYKVDPTNTTLYIDDDWPNRIGVFIRFNDE